MIHWTNRFAVLSTAMLSGALALLAQRSGPTPAGPGPGIPTASPTTGTRTNPTNPSNQPLNNGDNPNNSPFGNRPVFLSGKVMFDDGSPMNHDVRIQRTCGSNTRTEANVDGNGRFSVQFGSDMAAYISAADASESDPSGTMTRGQNRSLGSGSMSVSGFSSP